MDQNASLYAQLLAKYNTQQPLSTELVKGVFASKKFVNEELRSAARQQWQRDYETFSKTKTTILSSIADSNNNTNSSSSSSQASSAAAINRSNSATVDRPNNATRNRPSNNLQRKPDVIIDDSDNNNDDDATASETSDEASDIFAKPKPVPFVSEPLANSYKASMMSSQAASWSKGVGGFWSNKRRESGQWRNVDQDEQLNSLCSHMNHMKMQDEHPTTVAELAHKLKDSLPFGGKLALQAIGIGDLDKYIDSADKLRTDADGNINLSEVWNNNKNKNDNNNDSDDDDHEKRSKETDGRMSRNWNHKTGAKMHHYAGHHMQNTNGSMKTGGCMDHSTDGHMSGMKHNTDARMSGTKHQRSYDAYNRANHNTVKQHYKSMGALMNGSHHAYGTNEHRGSSSSYQKGRSNGSTYPYTHHNRGTGAAMKSEAEKTMERETMELRTALEHAYEKTPKWQKPVFMIIRDKILAQPIRQPGVEIDPNTLADAYRLRIKMLAAIEKLDISSKDKTVVAQHFK